MIHIIAAVCSNGVIGRDGKLPWGPEALKEDRKRFKTLTMGGILIMGRKTHESIGKPLPGRTNIILSRSAPPLELRHEDQATTLFFMNDLSAALLSAFLANKDAFVIGGAELYRDALPHAGRLHLTCVPWDLEGDVHFPEWDRAEWEMVHIEAPPDDKIGPIPFWFETWERRR